MVAIGTLIVHFGSTISTLVVERLLQGLAAALLYMAGLVLLRESWRDDNLGYAIGYLSLAITVAAFVGQVWAAYCIT